MTTAHTFASKAHFGQMYGNYPYMHHLQMVNKGVYQVYYNDEDCEILADLAWLHDSIEDVDWVDESALIDAGFSKRLVDAVVAITKNKGESRLEYICRCMENDLAKKVKIVDTMANLQSSIVTNEPRRIAKYCDQLKMLTA